MFNIPNYDNWKLDNGEGKEKIVCQCEQCDSDIYEGQEVFKADDYVFCDKNCCAVYLLDNYAWEEVAEDE